MSHALTKYARRLATARGYDPLDGGSGRSALAVRLRGVAVFR
jgi:hypothetical protein